MISNKLVHWAVIQLPWWQPSLVSREDLDASGCCPLGCTIALFTVVVFVWIFWCTVRVICTVHITILKICWLFVITSSLNNQNVHHQLWGWWLMREFGSLLKKSCFYMYVPWFFFVADDGIYLTPPHRIRLKSHCLLLVYRPNYVGFALLFASLAPDPCTTLLVTYITWQPTSSLDIWLTLLLSQCSVGTIGYNIESD